MDSETIQGESLTCSLITVNEDEEHIHHSSVSGDGLFLASVFGNGVLRVLDASTMEPIARLGPGAPYMDLPATGVQWFPTPSDCHAESGTISPTPQYKLITVSSAGGVFGWTFDGKALHRFAIADEQGNEIATVDISRDGKTFVTAGSDRTIRSYSSADFCCIAKMTQGVNEEGKMRAAHSNRVLSVRYITPTLLVSCGWESPVQLWDTRTGRAFGQISGVQACSDCVEPFNKTTGMFLLTSRNSSPDTPPILIARGVHDGVLAHESKTLCAQLVKLGHRLIVSRIDHRNGHVWCLSLAPHAVTVVAIASGDVVATILLPAIPMNMCLSGLPSPGYDAFVSCQGGALVALKLQAHDP